MVLHYTASSVDSHWLIKSGHKVYVDETLRNPEDFLLVLQGMVPFDDWMETCKTAMKTLALKHVRIFRICICTFEPKITICCDDGQDCDHYTYFVLWSKKLRHSVFFFHVSYKTKWVRADITASSIVGCITCFTTTTIRTIWVRK